MTCNDATLSLGVYLVGALEPAERAEVEAHLLQCGDCQRQLDELAALPSTLDLLRIEDIEPMQAASLGQHSDGSNGPSITPPEDLFERFAARARGEQPQSSASADELAGRRDRRQRFTRFRILTSAAAAVVVVGTGVGIGVTVTGNGQHRNPNHISVAQGPVRMQVTLASQTTGTSLDLEVSGLPDDEHCRLIAIGRDGSRDMAGQWNATYSGRAKFWGSTSIPRANLKQLVLLGTHGQTLVAASI